MTGLFSLSYSFAKGDWCRMAESNCLLPQRIQRACKCYRYTNTAFKCDFYTTAKITKSVVASRAINGALSMALLRKYSGFNLYPQCRYLLNYLRCWYPKWDLNPHDCSVGFEPTASAIPPFGHNLISEVAHPRQQSHCLLLYQR